MWDISQNSNGHNSVSFYRILKIQNSTDPYVKEVLEYVRYVCLAYASYRGSVTLTNKD